MRSLLLRRSAEFQRTASIVSIVVAIGSACLSFPAYLEFVIEAGRPMWVSTALAGVMAGACGAILHLNFLLIVDGVPLLDRMARHDADDGGVFDLHQRHHIRRKRGAAHSCRAYDR